MSCLRATYKGESVRSNAAMRPDPARDRTGSMPVRYERHPGYWRAGVTLHSEQFKPHLNGEPVTGAYEADTAEGYIKLVSIFDWNDQGAFERQQTLHGRVTLVRVPLMCR